MTEIFNNLNDRNEINAPWTDQVKETSQVIIYKDGFPVTPDHLVFVPKNNSVDCLVEAFKDAFNCGKVKFDQGDWQGFNIGFNYGKVAGQTVDWPHIHLIPRRPGDVEDPTGGVRNIIPGKGNYVKN